MGGFKVGPVMNAALVELWLMGGRAGKVELASRITRRPGAPGSLERTAIAMERLLETGLVEHVHTTPSSAGSRAAIRLSGAGQDYLRRLVEPASDP
jgi:hypothetical protein